MLCLVQAKRDTSAETHHPHPKAAWQWQHHAVGLLHCNRALKACELSGLNDAELLVGNACKRMMACTAVTPNVKPKLSVRPQPSEGLNIHAISLLWRYQKSLIKPLWWNYRTWKMQKVCVGVSRGVKQDETTFCSRKLFFAVTRPDWSHQALRDYSLFTLPYDCRWPRTIWKQYCPGATEVVGQVKGQLWDQQNSEGSLHLPTFSPGCDLTMTCSLSSGPDSAFWIPPVILSLNAPHLDLTCWVALYG